MSQDYDQSVHQSSSKKEIADAVQGVKEWQEAMLDATAAMYGNKQAQEKLTKNYEKIEKSKDSGYFRELAKKRKKLKEEIAYEKLLGEKLEDDAGKARDEYLAMLDKELESRQAQNQDIRPLLQAIVIAAAAHNKGEKEIPHALQGILGKEASLDQVFGKKRNFSKTVKEQAEKRLKELQADGSL